MAFTKDDLIAIKEAIASGELEVDVDGKRVKYRSIAELKEAKRMIEGELASQSGRRQAAFRGFRVVVDRGIR